MAQKIYHHEDLQRAEYVRFTAEVAARYHTGPLPPLSDVQGAVQASVRAGRWLVLCPACPGAQVASRVTPLFRCVECGSQENAGKWYRVIYPSDKGAIEAVLLKRPAKRPLDARERNWLPGETLVDLRKENIAHGVGV